MERVFNLLKHLAICQVKMLSYSMKKFWDTIINSMDQAWDKTIEFLWKLNSWIPLSAVLIAGIGLLSIVLILAVCGCVLRKRLVPHWLIWTYFTFATIIIMAHTGNNLAAIVEAIEIPVLVVLFSYILLLLFRRRPRYVYVEKTVYERQLAKGRVYRVDTDGQVIKNENKRQQKRQSKEQVVSEIENEAVQSAEKVDAEVIDETAEREAAMREVEKAEAAKLAAAEQAAREAREAEKETERKLAEQAARNAEKTAREVEPVKRVDKNDFLTARLTRPTLNSSTATTSVDLPTVNPIPDKSYEPTREPTIVTKPISQTIPGLKMTGSSNTTARYGSSFSRPATTTTRPSSFGTTRPTTTTTSTFNRTTSSTASKTPTTSTTRSTDDIMAAIERLRNSMKK